MKEFDVVILGGGPGGYVAAIRGAQLGAKVCLIEDDKVGGTCLNRGCIPTKALHASAKTLSMARKGSKFGVELDNISFNIEKAVSRKNEVVNKLVNGVEQLLRANSVEIVKGKGYFESSGVVKVEKFDGVEVINTKKIIIATGSEPAMIPDFNIDRIDILTSTEMLDIASVPKSLLIIGGGVMGCEFAGMFAEFGSKVTIVELLSAILSTEEKQISRLIAKRFKERGIDVYTNVSVQDIERVEGGVKTILKDGKEFLTEKVMVSIGRSFNSSGIGIEELGVNMQKGRIIVNERMETNVSGVYAVGDVVGGMLLAHVASSEGIVAVNNALGNEKKMEYASIPAGIFTDPEIASVGLKEADAKKIGIAIKIGRFPYIANGKALCMGEEEGFVQMIVDASTEKVLGCSIVGAHATDLIGEIALAVNAGMKVNAILETVHAHPTLPEVIIEAAEDVDGMAIHKVGRRRK